MKTEGEPRANGFCTWRGTFCWNLVFQIPKRFLFFLSALEYATTTNPTPAPGLPTMNNNGFSVKTGRPTGGGRGSARAFGDVHGPFVLQVVQVNQKLSKKGAKRRD